MSATPDCPRCAGLPNLGINYDKWPDDGHCKQCGSLDADVFMARVEAGTVTLDPTDKDYKAYVHNDGGDLFRRSFRTDKMEDRIKAAAANAKILRCAHVWDSDGSGSRCRNCRVAMFTTMALDERDDAEKYEAGETLDPMRGWKWATEESKDTKFYFQHLSDEQKIRFVELLNEKKLKLNAPGFFYRRPFFVGPV